MGEPNVDERLRDENELASWRTDTMLQQDPRELTTRMISLVAAIVRSHLTAALGDMRAGHEGSAKTAFAHAVAWLEEVAPAGEHEIEAAWAQLCHSAANPSINPKSQAQQARRKREQVA
jgi:hypothetical protein